MATPQTANPNHNEDAKAAETDATGLKTGPEPVDPRAPAFLVGVSGPEGPGSGPCGPPEVV